MHRRLSYRCCFATLCAILCAALAGCCSTCSNPRIDPTGQRLFTYDTPYKQVPGPIGHGDTTAVMVTPQKIIAPVNSEVVVQAAVCGQDRTLMAGEMVEWTIAPQSVGYIVQAGESGSLDWMHHVSYRTRKVDNTFAVSATSSKFIMLNRGTPTPSDDVPILRGQAWTTVSSPVEGTTFVSAVAPNVYGWNGRKQTATIYWVDAQWTLPPPAVNASGTRHAFTTLLVRHSNQCPLVGWRVRYEITGGPPAGFAPDGVQSIEVPTNALGQATVEIFQNVPAAGTSGTNTVNITIIRPSDFPGGDGAPLAVGSGATQMTWNTATSGGLWIDKSGPTEAAVGSTLAYRIVVRNPSDLTAKGLVVTDAVPTGLNYLGSTPQAAVSGSTLTWNLGDLGPGQSRQIELSFQATQPAVVNNCATVRAADGATAQDCAATTVTQPTVELTLVGPPQAVVGDQVTFTATIVNRGNSPATNLVILDRFDQGLKHDLSSSPIENRSLPTLAPGQTQRVNVNLRVVQPGRWCNTMELSGDGGIHTSAQACLTAVQPATPPPVVTPPPSTSPAAALPVLKVTKTGPTKGAVGDTIQFSIVVENRGAVPATNVRVLDNYDLALKPTKASPGWKLAGNDIYWDLPQLAPNQALEYKVECLCQSPAVRACNRATVTSQEGVRADAEACLEISGRRDVISVTVSDNRDPVSVGDEIAYTVRVTNNAPVSDGEVIVAVTLPNEATPAAGSQGPTAFALNNRTLRFAPVAEIRPGETVTYTIRSIARQAGAAAVRVEVTSNAAQTPIVATETTNVFAQ